MKFVLVAVVAVVFAALWPASSEYTWPDGSELTCLKHEPPHTHMCARSLEGYARWLETVLIPELLGTKSHMSTFGFRYSKCNDGVCYEEIGWGRELSECARGLGPCRCTTRCCTRTSATRTAISSIMSRAAWSSPSCWWPRSARCRRMGGLKAFFS